MKIRFVTGKLRLYTKYAASADIGMERRLTVLPFGSHALHLNLKGSKVTVNFLKP